MNWVGGARSRIRQQSEKKRQKEFFAKQKLRRDTALCRSGEQSPERKGSKPVSLDLLSLQIVQHASEAKGKKEDATCRMPYRQNLDLSGKGVGKLAGNGPWRTQDLSLPMSPIAQPSALELMDSSLYDERPFDKLMKVPPPPTAHKGRHVELHNLPPPRATSTVARHPTNSGQDHRALAPFNSSPLESSRFDVSINRLFTEAVLPRKRQLAVRSRSNRGVSEVPCDSLMGSAVCDLTAHEHTLSKKPALQQLQAVADGGRGKGRTLQQAPHQELTQSRRVHVPGAQQRLLQASSHAEKNLCIGDTPEICQRNPHTTGVKVVADHKVPYPTTCSLSSFEKMMMAVKVDAPAGRPDLVRESTPIAAADPSGQTYKQKKESSWFKFISNVEEPPVPSNTGQQGLRVLKQASPSGAHCPNLMADNTARGYEEEVNVAAYADEGTSLEVKNRGCAFINQVQDSNTDNGSMLAKTRKTQRKEQLAYCSALEELLELGESLNSSGEETTEDPIRLHVLELGRAPVYGRHAGITANLPEGFSMLHNMAAREGNNTHTQVTQLESNEGVVSNDARTSTDGDLHCYETMLPKGEHSPSPVPVPDVAASLFGTSVASASGSGVLAELEPERALSCKIHVCTTPLATRDCRLTSPHLKASQNETVAADYASTSTEYTTSTNGVTDHEPLLCEPNQLQEMPLTVLVSKATQTEDTERTIGIGTFVQTAAQTVDNDSISESHAMQTDEVQKSESAVQVAMDMVVMATVAPPPVGLTSTATQTSLSTVELNVSDFSQLSAHLTEWIARQEIDQMSEATRDVFACNLKELRGRIELSENSLIWLNILSKLSSIERN